MRGKTTYMVCVALAAAVVPLSGQERTTVATAGSQYHLSGGAEWLGGSNWRDLWTTPVQVPVLDLEAYAGGLTPERQGGRQSYTLHFTGADGRTYIFRSVDKFLHREALPVALRHTVVGDVVQDQISMLMPAAGLVVSPLYDAMGLLHPTPTLMVMPDDPRLGEFRARFAGMLGQMEENPNEGPDETPGFAGSSRIVGNDRMLERLDESAENRLHAPEYLVARLIQFMVADTDRGGDQWRFARLPVNGVELFRPIARDHDFAFMRPSGLFGTVARAGYAKLGRFDGTFESLESLTFMTSDMDRRLLAGLSRESWDSVVVAMQSQLTDDVLRAAAARLPVEWQPMAAASVVEGLQGRRDALPEVAADLYRMVFREVVVYGTDEDDRAEIERLADGSVEVRLYEGDSSPAQVAAQPAAGGGTARGADARLFYQRRFDATETSEIRLNMQGGDDDVRVTGSAPTSILLRVVGGAGDDVLVDSSRVAAGGTRTVFYTARGADEVIAGPNTRVDDRDYAEWLPGRPRDEQALVSRDEGAGADEDETEDEEETDKVEGLDEDVSERLGAVPYRDWGTRGGTGAAIDFRSRSGLLVGVGRSYTRHGFRHDPYRYHLRADALYAVDTGGLGLELFGDYRRENSSMGLSVAANATQYESFRFFGYGNDSPADPVSPRVTRDQITVRPAIYWARSGTHFGIGPVFRYGDAKYDEGSPIEVLQPLGAGSYAQAGGIADLRIERGALTGPNPRGVTLNATASAYPSLLDVAEPFGSINAHARAYVPLPGRPFVALRAGGQWVWGESFPVHEAAFLGGRTALRGYTTDRFVGDASVYGSSELHVPIATIELLVRGDLGIFGLADAGRVYMDGESPGSWHTAYGGGAWFTSLGRTLSLSYAEGETGRLYLRFGLPL